MDGWLVKCLWSSAASEWGSTQSEGEAFCRDFEWNVDVPGRGQVSLIGRLNSGKGEDLE